MIIFMILIAGLVIPVSAGDPSGAETYESDPTTSINFTWVLICGFLVMLMQAGFGLLEAGLTRAKNAANIMMKNMGDFCNRCTRLLGSRIRPDDGDCNRKDGILSEFRATASLSRYSVYSSCGSGGSGSTRAVHWPQQISGSR
jgi:hypothetical protein